MGRIKCIKIECPICHVSGLAQIFLNKDGRVRYSRVRHYKGLNQFRKPQFEYHKIDDLAELKTLLENQDFQFATAAGQVGQDNKTLSTSLHDPVVNKSSLKQQETCLGSLAWWGIALVRRRSRVQIPPEASNRAKGYVPFFSLR